MSRLALGAALVAIAGCASPPPDAPEPRIDAAPLWGPQQDGLRIRAVSPEVASCGDWLEIEVFADAAEGAATLTWHHPAIFVRVRLTTADGGDDVVLRVEDPTAGPPDHPPPDGSAQGHLVVAAGERLTCANLSLARAWDRLSPGAYTCVVEFVHDESITPEYAFDRELTGTFRGTLVSQSFPLELGPAPERFLDVRVPAALLGGDVDGRLRLPVRNGFTVALHFDGELADGSGGGGIEGGLEPGMFDDLLARIAAAPGDVSFTIFETSDTPGYHVPLGPTSRHYRVLFSAP